jgi:hypothetical protein
MQSEKNFRTTRRHRRKETDRLPRSSFDLEDRVANVVLQKIAKRPILNFHPVELSSDLLADTAYIVEIEMMIDEFVFDTELREISDHFRRGSFWQMDDNVPIISCQFHDRQKIDLGTTPTQIIPYEYEPGFCFGHAAVL